jgi:hypothetical protein
MHEAIQLEQKRKEYTIEIYTIELHISTTKYIFIH